MILLSIIALFLIATCVFLVLGGAGFIVVFGDVIICAAFIIWVVKRLIKK